jgi:hypoxanthine phosphoribosyltransferase
MIPADRIAARVAQLGARISEQYAGKNPLFVSILKGSIVFLSDLMRAVEIPHEIDFLAVSSYGSRTESSGRVRLLHDLGTEVRGRDVLLVEDVLDTGLTIRFLLNYLELRGPASLRVCALLQKSIDDVPAVEPDLIGFRIPDRFVIGYGMDLAGHYRNLPYLAALTDGGAADEDSARSDS